MRERGSWSGGVFGVGQGWVFFGGGLLALLLGCSAPKGSSSGRQRVGLSPSSSTSEGHPSAAAKPPSEPSRSLKNPRNESLAKSFAASQPTEIERKLIWRGQVGIGVPHFAPLLEKLRPYLRERGGYIARSDDHSHAETAFLSLEIRIPAGEFHALVVWLRGRGKIRYERLWSQDITSEYVDLAARLRTQRNLESRLLRILQEKTAELKDLLAVERELARVREGIERHESQQRTWDHLIAFSTLSLHVDAFSPSKTLSWSWPSFRDQIRGNFEHSLAAVVEFLQRLVAFLAGLLPWLPFLLLAGFLFRRWRKRKRASELSL